MDRSDDESDDIRQILAGDEAACRRFVRQRQPLVARIAHGMLGAGDEAEDVGQEAFIRCFRALPTFRQDASLDTWLTRVTMNLALDALARRKRRLSWVRLTGGERDDTIGLATMAPPMGADREERQSAVRAAVAALDPPHRAVVVLRILEERSVRDTAELLKIPEGTVMSRLKRALVKLAPVLTAWRDDVG